MDDNINLKGENLWVMQASFCLQVICEILYLKTKMTHLDPDEYMINCKFLFFKLSQVICSPNIFPLH